MTYIWLAKQHNGYEYAFSTREKAETWFENEVENQGGRELFDDCTEEETNDEEGHSYYCCSELVAEIWRVEIDKEEING